MVEVHLRSTLLDRQELVVVCERRGQYLGEGLFEIEKREASSQKLFERMFRVE